MKLQALSHPLSDIFIRQLNCQNNKTVCLGFSEHLQCDNKICLQIIKTYREAWKVLEHAIFIYCSAIACLISKPLSSCERASASQLEDICNRNKCGQFSCSVFVWLTSQPVPSSWLTVVEGPECRRWSQMGRSLVVVQPHTAQDRRREFVYMFYA